MDILLAKVIGLKWDLSVDPCPPMGPYEHRHTGGGHLRMTAEIKVRFLGAKSGSGCYHRNHPEFILLLRREADSSP